MKTQLWITTAVAIVAVAISSADFAFGGGRGGGGGADGGGARPSAGPSGGGARTSAGPSGGGARPSAGPSAGGARPSAGPAVGSSPSFSHPGGANNAKAPAQSPRPNNGVGQRPASTPGSLPGVGAAQGAGASKGTANASKGGNNVVVNNNSNRVGVSQQPARLPGLGGAGAASQLPNQAGNRAQTPAARQGDLSNRMSSGREDRQGNRTDMQNDRQDHRNNSREDWQNFADDHHANHGDWYHDCWHPGAGWNHMWDNYPVAAAFGVTAWGVNRLAYGFGYWGYSNPYASSSVTYNYSEPLVSYSDSGSSAAPAEATPAEQADSGKTAFNDARTAFYEGDAPKALTLLDTALKTMPRDTVVHEFRSLVLFALKKYPESAAAIYAVLSAGPGWDWTTMSSLYPSVDGYTQQLRALEDFMKANPKSTDAHFLLGYHYLTATHTDAAAKQFKLAQSQLPDDKLLMQLLSMTAPADEPAKTATPPAAADVPAEKVLSAEKLVGTWKASSQGAQFQLDLAKDGTFVWTYSRGKDKQSVKGVFAVDQNNLALEPDAGGTMLSEVDLTNPSQFVFKMIGGDAKDPGLEFKKS